MNLAEVFILQSCSAKHSTVSKLKLLDNPDHQDVSAMQLRERLTFVNSSPGSIASLLSKMTPTPLNKNELKSTFSKKYSSIREYASKAVWALSNNVEVDDLISECYLYVWDRAEEIKDSQTLEAWSKNYIKMSLHWNNTPVNRMVRKENVEIFEYDQPVSNPTNFDNLEEETRKFEDTLTSLEKRLFNIYYTLDLRTGDAIAKHLGISRTSGYNLIPQCKEIENRFKKHLTRWV